MATEQIGVLGNTVYFGGTAIGTITGNGANGGSLVVSFNANATPNAVEHLIENLTYQNFLSNPEPSRTVSLRLADGSGGVTAPLAITLDIVANPDGAVMYGAEQVVSRVAGSGNQAGDQANPVMAMLDGGGYVVAYTDTSGLDGNGYGIFARRYDANDNPWATPSRSTSPACTPRTSRRWSACPAAVSRWCGRPTIIWWTTRATASSCAATWPTAARRRRARCSSIRPSAATSTSRR
jgi:hypothetical protein